MNDALNPAVTMYPSPALSHRVTLKCAECELEETAFKINHQECQAIYESAKRHTSGTGHIVVVQEIGLVFITQVEGLPSFMPGFTQLLRGIDQI